MARRSKVDAEKTRSRILETALALFVKKGYEHTTFTDIAARMKMTKGVKGESSSTFSTPFVRIV